MIYGKQYTIPWYVDDNELSHEDPNVVTKVLDKVANHFGELDINRGDKNYLLGIHITLNRKKSVIEIDMRDI